MSKGFERVVREVIASQRKDGIKVRSIYGTPMGDFEMKWDETGFHMTPISPSALEYFENDAFAPPSKKPNRADLIQVIEWLDDGAGAECCELEWLAEMRRNSEMLDLLRAVHPESKIVEMWDEAQKRKRG